MPVLVRLHLRQAQDGVLTLPAVVVRLLAVVAAPRGGAELGGGELLEAGGHDGVQLLVLASMSHHLVGVRAEVVALEAVEMTRTLLVCTCIMLNIEFALFPSARHSPKALELVSAERIESLVPGGVLHETSLVAEAVVAVLAHAVEMSLVLAVVAVGELAVLVKPESHVAVWYGFILQHSHAGLESHFLLIQGQAHVIIQLYGRGSLLVYIHPFLGSRPSRTGKGLGGVKEAAGQPGVTGKPLERVRHSGNHDARVREKRIHSGRQHAGRGGEERRGSGRHPKRIGGGQTEWKGGGDHMRGGDNGGGGDGDWRGGEAGRWY